MYAHHLESIARIRAYFQNDPAVRALLLGGSLAHGFATPASDIDLLIIVRDSDHAARAAARELHFFNQELCTYAGGYADGKYIAEHFLHAVAASGSDPARFAFLHAQVLFSQLPDLEQRLQDITRYPTEHRAERVRRFYAQFEAWHWYCDQALQQANPYLLLTAVSKMILFGGRLILTHNELLYPYHKWFLRVLADAPDKPPTLMEQITNLSKAPTRARIDTFYKTVLEFQPWHHGSVDWPTRFLIDSELNWLNGHPPVDDL